MYVFVYMQVNDVLFSEVLPLVHQSSLINGNTEAIAALVLGVLFYGMHKIYKYNKDENE